MNQHRSVGRLYRYSDDKGIVSAMSFVCTAYDSRYGLWMTPARGDSRCVSERSIGRVYREAKEPGGVAANRREQLLTRGQCLNCGRRLTEHDRCPDVVCAKFGESL